MATWPSGTKASTANVDSPQDLISQARADIKQNIDNVNNIIDSFDIGTPTEGTVLSYNSGTSDWQQIDPNTVLTPNVIVQLSGTGVSPSGSPSIVYANVTELYDNANIASVASDTLTIEPGTYLLEIVGKITSDVGSPPEETAADLYVYNVDTSSNQQTIETNPFGSEAEILTLTPDSASSNYNLKFRIEIAGSDLYRFASFVKLFKLS